jgi:methylmalonyl-CoA/ethylmalonyl-CoA epimerase
MPGGPFAHVCFLVRDLDKAIEDWTKILKVFDPAQVEQPIVRQHWESGDDVMEAATFVNPDGCEIQLLSPLNEDGPVGRRLAKHGEGVHHLCFTSANLQDAVDELDAQGIKLTSTKLVGDPSTPWQAWTFVAPESSHGPFVELAYPYTPVDGRWEPGPGVDASSSGATA